MYSITNLQSNGSLALPIHHHPLLFLIKKKRSSYTLSPSNFRHDGDLVAFLVRGWRYFDTFSKKYLLLSIYRAFIDNMYQGGHDGEPDTYFTEK